MRTLVSGQVRAMADAVGEGEVVALTGAGISADSGMPTFSDLGGLWRLFDPVRHGTWQGIVEEAMVRPDALADLLAGVRGAFVKAHPGGAHRALAHLEEAGLLVAVATQNVDGLHQDAGSREVIELHGSLRRLRCMSCGSVEAITKRQLLSGLSHMITGLRSAFIPSLHALLPRCSQCGGPARPDVVTFGEAVQDFECARDRVASCRTLLVIGTSGLVAPASELPAIAGRNGARIVEIVLEETLLQPDLRIRGRANRVLGALVRELSRGPRRGSAFPAAARSGERDGDDRR